MGKNEKSYYEILEIGHEAAPEEIEKAFGKAMALYGEDSVALYSLYTAEERKERLRQLADMYATLMDPVKRKTYDDYLRGAVGESKWSAGEVGAGRDVFDEYNEAGAFKDRIAIKKTLCVNDGHDPMITEKFRILYKRLEEISIKRSFKTFSVTSAVKGEGKTTTAMNLAYIAATEFKKKVLLMETDFRNPSISSSYLDMGRLCGLVDVIKGDADLKSALSRLDDTTLYFLPARLSVKNSSVLLDSPRMRAVFSRVKDQFDYVIVDSPPVLPLVDINILSKAVDGMLLVVKAGSTPKDIVAKAAGTLPKENLIGIVLNGADSMHMKKYYY